MLQILTFKFVHLEYLLGSFYDDLNHLQTSLETLKNFHSKSNILIFLWAVYILASEQTGCFFFFFVIKFKMEWLIFHRTVWKGLPVVSRPLEWLFLVTRPLECFWNKLSKTYTSPLVFDVVKCWERRAQSRVIMPYKALHQLFFFSTDYPIPIQGLTGKSRQFFLGC